MTSVVVKMYPFHDSEREVEFNNSIIQQLFENRGNLNFRNYRTFWGNHVTPDTRNENFFNVIIARDLRSEIDNGPKPLGPGP